MRSCSLPPGASDESSQVAVVEMETLWSVGHAGSFDPLFPRSATPKSNEPRPASASPGAVRGRRVPTEPGLTVQVDRAREVPRPPPTDRHSTGGQQLACAADVPASHTATTLLALAGRLAGVLIHPASSLAQAPTTPRTRYASVAASVRATQHRHSRVSGLSPGTRFISSSRLRACRITCLVDLITSIRPVFRIWSYFL